MKIAIFGGTGKTGKHLVLEALNAGHDVTILARTPSKLGIEHPALQIIQGDLANVSAIETTIAGADVVMSVLGPTPKQTPFAISTGITNILTAMKKHGVNRLVISAGAGVGDPNDKPKFVDRLAKVALKTLSKQAYEDMNRVVEIIKASDVQWTVIRVPMLTDQPKKNKIRMGYLGGDVGIRLSRADMAEFMLHKGLDKAHLHKAPVISN
ncbi:MAG: SDR family oxidoreductase [Phototrophicales bacterium]|nr:SDR family oxidoreductase [Phototrophicales bacterium]